MPTAASMFVEMPVTPKRGGQIFDFSGEVRPRHHHDELEFNLSVRGCGIFFLGARKVVVRPGTLLWFLRGQDHVLAMGGVNDGHGGNNGGNANGASGGSLSAGSGGTGAVCADVASDPEILTPAAPLPVRFVLLYDPAVDDPHTVGATSDYAVDCGQTGVNEPQLTGLAPWGECVARHLVDDANAAYADLLGTAMPRARQLERPSRLWMSATNPLPSGPAGPVESV